MYIIIIKSIKLTLVWPLQQTRYDRKSLNLIICPLSVTMTLEIATNCFCAMSSGKIINIPAKRSTGHKLQDRQTLRIQPRTLHCDLNFEIPCNDSDPVTWILMITTQTLHQSVYLAITNQQTRSRVSRLNCSEDMGQTRIYENPNPLTHLSQ